MRGIALAALEQYGVNDRRLTLMTHHLNLLYRVDTTTGERFALRISNPAWRSPLELASELQWLAALSHETDIGAHEPIVNRSGDLVTEMEIPGVPEVRRCVLFTWIPGVEVVQRLTSENVEKMGVLSARLHQHAATFKPQAPFTNRRLDRLFPRDEDVVLFDAAYESAFSLEQRNVFEQTMERAQAELDRLYRRDESPRVVHGDLHHENIKVSSGKLHPIDFEDVIWAYPIQDIALTFYDFRYYTDPQVHDYAELCATFERGYTSVLPWPQEYPSQIDILHAARQIWVANWVLQNEDAQHHAPFITRLATRFEQLR